MTRITATVVVQDACAKIVEKAGNRRQFHDVREAAQVRPSAGPVTTLIEPQNGLLPP